MILKNRKSIKNGSIITELLITIILILITLLTVMPMIFMGTKSTKITKNRAIEIKIAQEEIENFNKEKFSDILDKIKNLGITNFENGTNSYSELKILYVNPNTGEIKKNQVQGDYNKLNIQKTYSYIVGSSSLLDDAIQLVVKVQVEGKSGKPVSLTSILNRDKL